jgi:hypothetical protein
MDGFANARRRKVDGRSTLTLARAAAQGRQRKRRP